MNFNGDNHGVAVIIIGNGIGNQSSKPGQDCFEFHFSLCFTPYIIDLPSSINTSQWECQTVVHQSVWHNHVWYHLHSRRIVTTTLDSQLSINLLLFNQVHLYLVSVTWIYMFFYQTFYVPHVFLWSVLQHFEKIWIHIPPHPAMVK